MRVGYGATLRYSSDCPDDDPQKPLDVSALSVLGWAASKDLMNGIATTYKSYETHIVWIAAIYVDRDNANDGSPIQLNCTEVNRIPNHLTNC